MDRQKSKPQLTETQLIGMVGYIAAQEIIRVGLEPILTHKCPHCGGAINGQQ